MFIPNTDFFFHLGDPGSNNNNNKEEENELVVLPFLQS
jgi:hypothetical protein